MCLSNMLCVSLQADAKLREEEKRALRYLETCRECNSVQAVSDSKVFVTSSLCPVSSITIFVSAQMNLSLFSDQSLSNIDNAHNLSII